MPILKLHHTLRGHTGHVRLMSLSTDGRRLASPSEDRSVMI